jgi:hypothetical protein
MRVLITTLLLAALTACGTSIESADESHVSISYNNYADSPDSLRPMAQEHCASYQRLAVYQGTTLGAGTLGFLTALPLHAEFECRQPREF